MKLSTENSAVPASGWRSMCTMARGAGPAPPVSSDGERGRLRRRRMVWRSTEEVTQERDRARRRTRSTCRGTGSLQDGAQRSTEPTATTLRGSLAKRPAKLAKPVPGPSSPSSVSGALCGGRISIQVAAPAHRRGRIDDRLRDARVPVWRERRGEQISVDGASGRRGRPRLRTCLRCGPGAGLAGAADAQVDGSDVTDLGRPVDEHGPPGGAGQALHARCCFLGRPPRPRSQLLQFDLLLPSDAQTVVSDFETRARARRGDLTGTVTRSSPAPAWRCRSPIPPRAPHSATIAPGVVAVDGSFSIARPIRIPGATRSARSCARRQNVAGISTVSSAATRPQNPQYDRDLGRPAHLRAAGDDRRGRCPTHGADGDTAGATKDNTVQAMASTRRTRPAKTRPRRNRSRTLSPGEDAPRGRPSCTRARPSRWRRNHAERPHVGQPTTFTGTGRGTARQVIDLERGELGLDFHVVATVP